MINKITIKGIIRPVRALRCIKIPKHFTHPTYFVFRKFKNKIGHCYKKSDSKARYPMREFDKQVRRSKIWRIK